MAGDIGNLETILLQNLILGYIMLDMRKLNDVIVNIIFMVFCLLSLSCENDSEENYSENSTEEDTNMAEIMPYSVNTGGGVLTIKAVNYPEYGVSGDISCSYDVANIHRFITNNTTILTSPNTVSPACEIVMTTNSHTSNLPYMRLKWVYTGNTPVTKVIVVTSNGTTINGTISHITDDDRPTSTGGGYSYKNISIDGVSYRISTISMVPRTENVGFFIQNEFDEYPSTKKITVLGVLLEFESLTKSQITYKDSENITHHLLDTDQYSALSYCGIDGQIHNIKLVQPTDSRASSLRISLAEEVNISGYKRYKWVSQKARSYYIDNTQGILALAKYD